MSIPKKWIEKRLCDCFGKRLVHKPYRAQSSVRKMDGAIP
jgi:hypothetical protein